MCGLFRLRDVLSPFFSKFGFFRNLFTRAKTNFTLKSSYPEERSVRIVHGMVSRFLRLADGSPRTEDCG
jgi:hypothetical protein